MHYVIHALFEGNNARLCDSVILLVLKILSQMSTSQINFTLLTSQVPASEEVVGPPDDASRRGALQAALRGCDEEEASGPRQCHRATLVSSVNNGRVSC